MRAGDSEFLKIPSKAGSRAWALPTRFSSRICLTPTDSGFPSGTVSPWIKTPPAYLCVSKAKHTR